MSSSLGGEGGIQLPLGVGSSDSLLENSVCLLSLGRKKVIQTTLDSPKIKPQGWGLGAASHLCELAGGVKQRTPFAGGTQGIEI